MSDPKPGSLKQEIVRVKMRHNGTGLHGGPHDADRYADLGEADLPPSAAVRLADMTGRNVGFFEAVGSIDHPGLDELERVDHE